MPKRSRLSSRAKPTARAKPSRKATRISQTTRTRRRVARRFRAPRVPVDGAALSAPPRVVSVATRFREISSPQKRAYLCALVSRWHFEAAAAAAGVEGRTGYNWRADKSDVVFQAAFERAGELFVERAEAELWRRGIEGVEKPVYQGGELVGTVREYSDTAAIFMLKGAKPEKYRERFEHSGELHGKFDVLLSTAKGTLERKLARLIEQGGAAGLPRESHE
jgi:hypothetical protein